MKPHITGDEYMLYRRSDELVRHIDDLRTTIMVKDAYPFAIPVTVVLPEHLHAKLHLLPDDADGPRRWSFIKAEFLRRLVNTKYVCQPPSRA